MKNFLVFFPPFMSTVNLKRRNSSLNFYMGLWDHSPRGSNIYCHFDGAAFQLVLMTIVSPLLAPVNCLFFELLKIAFSKESVNSVSLRLAMCSPQSKRSKGQGAPLCLESP